MLIKLLGGKISPEAKIKAVRNKKIQIIINKIKIVFITELSVEF